MRCHRHPDRETTLTCRDCGNPVCLHCVAETGMDYRLCYRCRDAIYGVPNGRDETRPHRRRFRDLSMLAKCLTVYVLVVGMMMGMPVSLLNLGVNINIVDINFSRYGHEPSSLWWMCGILETVLGWLGILAGILMIFVKPAGWWLGFFWSLAQMIPIIVDHGTLNRQFFHLGIKSMINGSGAGFNLVGLILAILFLVVRRQFEKSHQR